MKNNAIKKQLFAFLVICITLTVAACRAPSNDSQKQLTEQQTAQTGTQVSASPSLDAGAIAEAYGAHRNLPQVQGSGVVIKVLKDDTQGLKHQKFLLKVSENITILIAHNIDLAARVDDLHEGDVIDFKGEYIYTPKGGTVHWTHKDPRGNHQAGWLKHNGKTYE